MLPPCENMLTNLWAALALAAASLLLTFGVPAFAFAAGPAFAAAAAASLAAFPLPLASVSAPAFELDFLRLGESGAAMLTTCTGFASRLGRVEAAVF
jgi:hypothetical protein